MLNVVSIKPEFRSIRDSAEGYVSVRVLRVRVHNSDPFESLSEVRLHTRHRFADEFGEVNPLPEFGRNDQLEQPGIAGRLPSS
jgi:hypothetical protein